MSLELRRLTSKSNDEPRRIAVPLAVISFFCLAVVGCGTPATPGSSAPVPLRNFMGGGMFFPEAMGYWFHQYVEQEQVTDFLRDQGFVCESAGNPDGKIGPDTFLCQRIHRYLWGATTRTDTAKVAFRGNGSIELAEAGCQYMFFDQPEWYGSCKRFIALGAVFPDVDTFARVVTTTMLPAKAMGGAVGVNIGRNVPLEPLQDANDVVERLTRWHFNCPFPKQQYRTSFRGNVGTTEMLVCEQFSLRPLGERPQRQQVVVHYESMDLAILSMEVRLDDASVALPAALHVAKARMATAALPRIQLENKSGERFEILVKDVGVGSRTATLEGFEALTPDSRREILKAYLRKMDAQWERQPPTHLSYLNPTALEWYGPEAIPVLHEMLSDEVPTVGAALLKYLCAQEATIAKPQDTNALSYRPYRYALQYCYDQRRAALPKSVALMDRLLARNLNDHVSSDVRALNAFGDFRDYILHVIALGPDARESGAALKAVIANKDGLELNLQELIAEARGRFE